VKGNFRAGMVAGTLAAALVGAVPFAAVPAGASSMSMFRSSGTVANANWIEVGTLPDPIPGNVHVGSLFVDAPSRTRVFVFGSVFDWTCPEGERPPAGGHGGFEEGPVPPPETNCTLEGVRQIFGDERTLAFSVDKRLTTAQLKGTLSVSDHGGGGDPANPPVDMTWTGTGSPYSSTESGTFSEGGSTFRYRYSFTGRNATIGGRIGAMGFTDDADDESSGQLGSYKNASRSRER
jgi:hypothetical protein